MNEIDSFGSPAAVFDRPSLRRCPATQLGTSPVGRAVFARIVGLLNTDGGYVMHDHAGQTTFYCRRQYAVGCRGDVSGCRREACGRRRARTRAGVSWFGALFLLAFLAAAGAGGYYYYTTLKPTQQGPSNLLTYVVSNGPFRHIVTERGEVESSSNIEVRCEVQSRNTAGTAILRIAPAP